MRLSFYYLASIACCTFWFLTAIVLASTLGTLLGFANNNNRDYSPPTPPPLQDECFLLNTLYKTDGVYVHIFDANTGSSTTTRASCKKRAESCQKNMECCSTLCSNNECTSGVPECRYTDDHHAEIPYWCPSASGYWRGGTSWSYLQKDVLPAIGDVIFYGAPNVGMLFTTSRYPSSRTADPLCYFPIDGDTSERDLCGCGHQISRINRTGENCPFEDYSNRSYAHLTPSEYLSTFGNPPLHEIDMASLDYVNFVELTTSNLINYTKLAALTFNYTYNEVILRAWQLAYAEIPLIGIIYTPDGSGNTTRSKKLAYEVQHSFMTWTNQMKPVVTFDRQGFHCADSSGSVGL